MSEQTTPLQVHEVRPEHIGTTQTVIARNGDTATGMVTNVNHDARLIDESTIGSPQFAVAAIVTFITLYGRHGGKLQVTGVTTPEQMRSRHA